MLLTRVEEGRVAGYKWWRRAACYTRLAHFPILHLHHVDPMDKSG